MRLTEYLRLTVRLTMGNLMEREVGKTVQAMLTANARRATKFITDKLVVTASRRLFRGKIVRGSREEIVLKIGVPNYREREFIRRCKKAGEKFPVKKIQLQFPPKR